MNLQTCAFLSRCQSFGKNTPDSDSVSSHALVPHNRLPHPHDPYSNPCLPQFHPGGQLTRRLNSMRSSFRPTSPLSLDCLERKRHQCSPPPSYYHSYMEAPILFRRRPLIFGGTFPIDRPIGRRHPASTFPIDEPLGAEPAWGGARRDPALLSLQPPSITLASSRARQKTISESSSGSNKHAAANSTPKGAPRNQQGQLNAGQEGSGWFGGLFSKISLRPKNQMKLPDDKNPAVSISYLDSLINFPKWQSDLI